MLKIIIGIVQNNESKLLRIEEILEVAQFTDEEKYCLKYVLINLDNKLLLQGLMVFQMILRSSKGHPLFISCHFKLYEGDLF